MTSPRLLLVDDNPDLSTIVRILARKSGHLMTHRLDAESAWAGLDAERPDLILLDMNLPGTSGIEFLTRLRASPDHSTQAVALFFQPSLTQDLASGWDAGADYHVSKDLVISPDAWKQRLDEILAHLHGRASGSSIFIKDTDLPEAGWESPHLLLRLPLLNALPSELLQSILTRAVATGPLTTEILLAWMDGQPAPATTTGPVEPARVKECLLRLIDQIGCLFGTATCAMILKDIHDRCGGEGRRASRPMTTER